VYCTFCACNFFNITDSRRTDAPSLLMLEEELLDDDNINLNHMVRLESRGQLNDGVEYGPSNLIINYLPLDIDSIDLKVSISHIFKCVSSSFLLVYCNP